LVRSVEAALSAGAEVISLVPTRSGNGALEALTDEHEFQAPSLEAIERSFEEALAYVGQGRIFSTSGISRGSRAVRIVSKLGRPACTR
jgi:hypothetical protein